MKRLLNLITLIFICLVTIAQETEQNDLAKQIQNPIASLISVPFQNNLDFGANVYDPVHDTYHDRAMNTLNIQPVLPFTFGNVNLITRTIIPIRRLPLDIDDAKSGLGDVCLSLYLTSAKPKKVILGYGIALGLPTATHRVLGSGKWSAGPGVVVLVQPGTWTLGALVQNTWSYTGNKSRDDLNLFYSQIFITKSLEKGWYINSVPIITADWEAEEGENWTIPLGAGFGRLFKIKDLPLNAQLGWYKYIETPTNGPESQFRAQVALLFPK